MSDAIRADDVFALYRIPAGPTVAALRGLSVRVGAGERLVVQGPNGSGKTTLLRMLGGELAPSSGTLTVAGHDLSVGDPSTVTRLRREVLGTVEQNSGRALRPELDVVDNVALHLRIAGTARATARDRARQVLADLGLDELAHRRPPQLSGGEAQRVAVCAAVAHAPGVLLADEPTGALDAAAADEVYDLIAACAARSGATLVLVTHDPRAARIADRVVRIRDGRLSEQWDPRHPDDEQQVLDAAGWMRLPDAVRASTGARETVRVSERSGVAELRGTGTPGADVEPVAPPPAPLATPDGPLAVLCGVEVGFAGRTVLDGLDLQVRPATLTVLRGRSGSGKSTLLHVLLGLVDPDAGTAELGGTALAGLGRNARAALRRGTVAVGLQSGALVETADAGENVALARRASRLPVTGPRTPGAELLDSLGLGAVAHRPVRLLSGGERQRVVVARSLAVQRPMVVLDEPTSQQDEQHSARTAQVLAAAAAAGTAVVCATHDDVLAALADVVVELG